MAYLLVYDSIYGAHMIPCRAGITEVQIETKVARLLRDYRDITRGNGTRLGRTTLARALMELVKKEPARQFWEIKESNYINVSYLTERLRGSTLYDVVMDACRERGWNTIPID